MCNPGIKVLLGFFSISFTLSNSFASGGGSCALDVVVNEVVEKNSAEADKQQELKIKIEMEPKSELYDCDGYGPFIPESQIEATMHIDLNQDGLFGRIKKGSQLTIIVNYRDWAQRMEQVDENTLRAVEPWFEQNYSIIKVR